MHAPSSCSDSSAAVTISDMPRKKPSAEPETDRVDQRESFLMTDDLRAAFEEFLSSTDPRPSKSAVIRTALERFFASKGFWPRKPKKDS
jgi:hypothetical protein